MGPKLGCDTPLAKWLKETGTSRASLNRLLRVSMPMVTRVVLGLSMPSLVLAFKIEQATNGGVPAVSWLGTDLARSVWGKTFRSSYENRVQYNAEWRTRRTEEQKELARANVHERVFTNSMRKKRVKEALTSDREEQKRRDQWVANNLPNLDVGAL